MTAVPINRYLFFLYIAIVTFVSAFHFVYQEYIPINNGFGFEGAHVYLPITKNFGQMIGDIDSYTIQRILPFATGWSILTILNNGSPISDIQVFLLWILFNYLQIVLICVFWHRISRHSKLGNVACLTGFAILILNFATIKLDYYYNFGYDRTALLFGIIILYYYLTNNIYLLLAVSVLSLTVWPTFILISAIMLFFPSNRPVILSDNKDRLQKYTSNIIPLVAATTITVVFFAIWQSDKLVTMTTTAKPVESLLPVSIILAGSFVYLSLNYVLKQVDLFKTAKRDFRSSTSRALSVLVLLAVYILLTKVIANVDAPVRSNFTTYICNIAQAATQRPLQFLVAHCLYFGPGFFLLLLLSRHIVKSLHYFGSGMILIVMFMIIQGLSSESRQMINLLPFIALLVAIAIDKVKAGYRFLSVFFISSLVISKIWLRINPDPAQLPKGMFQSFPATGNTQTFPAQRYFMNFVPWANLQTFLIQTIVLILLCSLIYVYLKSDVSRTSLKQK